MSTPSAQSGPGAAYRERLQRHAAQANRLLRREAVLSNLRLAVAVVGLALLWFAFGTHTVAASWLLAPGSAFAALAVAHDRSIRARERAQRRAAFHRAGLSRLEDCWMGTGQTGEALRSADHPYADDLDIFGTGSLFELLCTARTPAGERKLARWLENPADRSETLARQQAVRELIPRLDLREDLALLGETTASRLAPVRLCAWGEAEGPPLPQRLRFAAACLATIAVSTLVGWLALGLGPAPLLATLIAEAIFALALRRRVAPILLNLEAPTRDLAILATLLERIEIEEVTSPRLVALRQSLDTAGKAPSQQVARLRRLSDLADARRNQFFAPIAALLLWGTQVALAVESWRVQCGPRLAAWIDAAAEFEALCALSAYAYDNPSDPFPEIVDQGPLLVARAIGHPLLPRDRCVRNDIALGTEHRGFVMSGSNMSGKSTMLRSVGVNAVLALAGAPVRADALRISPLRIGASLQVRDSLQAGVSHFYAELIRLRQIVALAEAPGDPSTLFLLDEVLHGTNSHDRRIGAEALLRGLLDRGAIGIATTHDLALSRIADDLAPALANVHFADQIEDAQLCFDYRLHSGVVQGSNALALMRSVGLDV